MLMNVIVSQDQSPDPNRYNDPPNGLREISETEFAKSTFFTYPILAIEFRQVLIGDSYKHLNIFWMNTNPKHADGFAVSADYWGGKVTYYRVGCDHRFVELSQEESERKGHRHWGMCYHIFECEKCGKIEKYDSGD